MSHCGAEPHLPSECSAGDQGHQANKVADIAISDDGLQYVITPKGLMPSFEVDGTELFKASTELDHESKSGYAVTVSASDWRRQQYAGDGRIQPCDQ